MKNLILIILIASTIVGAGCGDISNSLLQPKNEKKLYAPMSEQSISNLVVVGMPRGELLEKCGSPYSVGKANGMEEIEFMLSFDKVLEPSDNVSKPNDWMIARFAVTVSNNYVVSWRVSSTATVR